MSSDFVLVETAFNVKRFKKSLVSLLAERNAPIKALPHLNNSLDKP